MPEGLTEGPSQGLELLRAFGTHLQMLGYGTKLGRNGLVSQHELGVAPDQDNLRDLFELGEDRDPLPRCERLFDDFPHGRDEQVYIRKAEENWPKIRDEDPAKLGK